VAGPLASLVLEAHQLAQDGCSADEVEAYVRALAPRARIYFLVDTLTYLQRGGRIGGAAALIGTVIQIKPILGFIDGRVEPVERERTRHRALARLQEMVRAEAAPGPEGRLTVMHAAARDQAAALAADLQRALGGPLPLLMDLVPAVVTYSGPGALAVGFFMPEQT
jgi:DegV family protein with EDD domain